MQCGDSYIPCSTGIARPTDGLTIYRSLRILRIPRLDCTISRRDVFLESAEHNVYKAVGQHMRQVVPDGTFNNEVKTFSSRTYTYTCAIQGSSVTWPVGLHTYQCNPGCPRTGPQSDPTPPSCIGLAPGGERTMAESTHLSHTRSSSPNSHPREDLPS